MRVYSEHDYDFVFAIGDDWTDEFMFQELPRKRLRLKLVAKKPMPNTLWTIPKM